MQQPEDDGKPVGAQYHFYGLLASGSGRLCLDTSPHRFLRPSIPTYLDPMKDGCGPWVGHFANPIRLLGV